ncbi:MAG: hypothetical protein V4492_02595 [Chlamydiota bacterium]
MTDVSQVHGPVGPQDPSQRKDRSTPDPDKFKKMHLIEEVKHTDPDEQKKRKRPEEAEEENKRMAASSFEMQDESGPLEQESFLETFSTTSETATPPTTAEPSSTPTAPLRPFDLTAPSSTSAPEQPAPVAPTFQEGTNERTQPQAAEAAGPSSGTPTSSQQPETPVTVSDQELQKQIDMGKHNISAPAPQLHKKEASTSGPIIEEVEQKKPEQATFNSQQLEQDLGEKEKEQEKGSDEATAPPPRLSDREKKKEDQSIAPIDTSGLQPTGAELPMMALPAPPPEGLPSYTTLTPQVMELFDRMVGTMTVMTASDMTETVVTLNAPQFASSVFFGSQIIIQEFSSAPKQFNIKLNGSAQAVALFQGNADDLMAAFQGGKFGFKVHRLETGLLEDQPLFKRKEKTSGDGGDGETKDSR